jgi:hypothetical protein
MNILAVILIMLVITAADMLPLLKKKQGKEAAVLLALGAVTMAYGYYYSTHEYSASLVKLLFDLLNMR